MIISREVFLAIGMAVLVISIVAMMLQLMMTSLVVDDWFELRSEPKDSPAKMVAEDELWTSIGRNITIVLVLIIGIAWVVVSLSTLPSVIQITPLTFIVAFTAIGHTLLAVINGVRSLMFRRKMARMLSGTRRLSRIPVEHEHGLHSVTHDAVHEH